jgi:hypothetical protein
MTQNIQFPSWCVTEFDSTLCNIREDHNLNTHTTQISNLILSLTALTLQCTEQDLRPSQW